MPLRFTGKVCKYAQFGLFDAKIFQMTLPVFRAIVYNGSHYEPTNSGIKI